MRAPTEITIETHKPGSTDALGNRVPLGHWAISFGTAEEATAITMPRDSWQRVLRGAQGEIDPPRVRATIAKAARGHNPVLLRPLT